MKDLSNLFVALVVAATLVLSLGSPQAAKADVIIQEDFNAVTGTGGGEFFVGNGESVIDGWDDGILDEHAFAGATDRAYSHASATGVSTGVDGTGAGEVSVTSVTFNPLNLDFENVSGNPGGGIFLTADGGDEGYMDNWDNKIEGEAAFGGVADGASLTGTMSAQAIQGAGYAELDVNGVTVNSGMWWAGVMFAAPALEGSIVLGNPGFDNGEDLAPWTIWGNSYAEPGATGNFAPLSGDRALKMYGNFQGAYNTSGAWQDLPAVEGQTWEIDCYTQHVAGDSLLATQNFVEMKIEFRDAADQVIGTNGVIILDSSSPLSTWIDAPAVQATAPAGTVAARALFVFHQPAQGLYEGGAGIVEDATFRVVAGPPQSVVDLSSIDLTADVRGTVDAAGEILGDYQLRIEDSEGDRLVFYGTADGTWQTVGGPLSTATETDNLGNPTSGVFNTDSPSFTVVLTFDNDTTVTWGSGGTLDFDNVLLTGTDPKDSEWYAGAFWNDLALPSPDLDQALLSADIKGDVVGGDYVLRVEGLIFNSNGIDQGFDDITGTGAQIIVNYDMTTSGVYSGWSDNWDTGIVDEAAFGGLAAGSLFCSETECPGLADVGVTARAYASGGNPGAYGQIKMTGLWEIAPGGDWYGGLMWTDQALASTDLSEITLMADVKGEVDSFWGETYGSIELRIEDDQGDRLYVRTTASSGWQTIGGTLDTFTEAPRAGGGGDGTFNLDSLNYTVVIAFDEPYATWNWGGAILVDNVYLTPADVAVELGRITFAGVADGGFQQIGGRLSEGVSTFSGNLDEHFENGTGESLTFWPGSWGDAEFDTGLQDEAYFAGTWGSGYLGAVTVQSCLDCGIDGTAGVEMIVENPASSSGGGWWSGVAWNNQRTYIDDLSELTMSAKVKATLTSPSSQYGRIILKLEDPNLDALEFGIEADGTWQDIGGLLSTAAEVASGNTTLGSDGIFDVHAPAYKVIVQTFGMDTPDWAGSHTIAIDDVFLTKNGYSIFDAEAYTVAIAFENEMETWGTSGALTFDNLQFTSVAATSCDGDDDIDLVDFAIFQQCFGTDGSGDCGCADVDGNGVVDIADYSLFEGFMTGPQ